jgi:hypothetical protein
MNHNDFKVVLEYLIYPTFHFAETYILSSTNGTSLFWRLGLNQDWLRIWWGNGIEIQSPQLQKLVWIHYQMVLFELL